VSDNRKPYLGPRGTHTGRVPYLGDTKTNTKRVPYLGGSSTQAAPKEHKHHGFLSTLKHVVTQTPKDLGNAALQAPGGIVKLGTDVGNDVAGAVGKSGIAPKRSAAARHANDKLFGRTKADAKLLAKQTVETVKHPLRHPGDTALLALPVVVVSRSSARPGRWRRAARAPARW
jgi:hypothetical protein